MSRFLKEQWSDLDQMSHLDRMKQMWSHKPNPSKHQNNFAEIEEIKSEKYQNEREVPGLYKYMTRSLYNKFNDNFRIHNHKLKYNIIFNDDVPFKETLKGNLAEKKRQRSLSNLHMVKRLAEVKPTIKNKEYLHSYYKNQFYGELIRSYHWKEKSTKTEADMLKKLIRSNSSHNVSKIKLGSKKNSQHNSTSLTQMTQMTQDDSILETYKGKRSENLMNTSETWQQRDGTTKSGTPSVSSKFKSRDRDIDMDRDISKVVGDNDD